MLTCPNCHKKYPTPVLACPKCQKELVPPSALKLHKEHPGLAPSKSVKATPKSGRAAQDHGQARSKDIYVTAHTGSLQEVKEVIRIMEKEGIPFRVTGHDDFDPPLRPEEGEAIADPEGMAVQVPSSYVEKARAVLDWEAQSHEKNRGLGRATPNGLQEKTLCPGCESEISVEDATCPSCGQELDENDMDEEEYYCSSCGEPCNLEDPACENCGTHFDH